MSAQMLSTLGVIVLSLVLAPLLPGIINRIKARMAGRQGRPLLQLYYDLNRLLRKGPVYSHTTSWIFKAGPVVVLSTTLFALCLVPPGGFSALLPFTGDFILLAGLFAMGRFAMMLAALDTGSAFEGMGAAREALFSSLAEPVFLFCLMLLGYAASSWSLSHMLSNVSLAVWSVHWPFFLLAALTLFLLLLLENCRIPVDDPNTHLELTMIHEVMILDHSGPDLALLEYAAALKLWIFALLISGVIMPVFDAPLFTPEGNLGKGGSFALILNDGITLSSITLVAVLVGFVESSMARMRMERVPQVITLAAAFACLASLILWRLL